MNIRNIVKYFKSREFIISFCCRFTFYMFFPTLAVLLASEISDDAPSTVFYLWGCKIIIVVACGAAALNDSCERVIK